MVCPGRYSAANRAWRREPQRAPSERERPGAPLSPGLTMEDAVCREPVHTKPHPFANLLQNRLSRTRAACPGPCPSGVIDVAADSRHEALGIR